jgi:uncharacterized membrane protein
MMRCDSAWRPSPAVAREVRSVEMLIGIALIVIAVVMIVFIIRTVQGNMGKA